MANETINWYPGHMKKATRMMEDSLRLVDAVVELRDARIPNSSRNPDVERIVGSKPRLIVLNRADQADAAATALWKKALTGEGALALGCGMIAVTGVLRHTRRFCVAEDVKPHITDSEF